MVCHSLACGSPLQVKMNCCNPIEILCYTDIFPIPSVIVVKISLQFQRSNASSGAVCVD